MFCVNKDCSKYTFSETFTFLDKKTKRLIDEIIRVSLVQSSISASNYLSESTVEIKKSSICSYLKKNIKKSSSKINYWKNRDPFNICGSEATLYVFDRINT